MATLLINLLGLIAIVAIVWWFWIAPRKHRTIDDSIKTRRADR